MAGQGDDWKIYDAVFCRNVLIYFSAAAVVAALDLFASCLKPGGYLLLGHSESLIGRREDFEPVCVNGRIVYRKRRAG